MPNKTKRKIDRRIQRTRNLLRDALMRLILQTDAKNGKRYDEITIQDITDEANVARTTFYLHFKDKDELLFETMRDIYEELSDDSQEITLEDFVNINEQHCYAEDFQHVAEYPEFYRIMLGERGSAAFLVRVREFLAEVVYKGTFTAILPDKTETRAPIDLVSHMVAGAQIGIIKWWLDNDTPYSPREIAFMTECLLKRGILWGLNLDEIEKQISE